MENNPEITIAEIAEKVSKSTRAVEKQLANLKKQGKIEREGPFDLDIMLVNRELKLDIPGTGFTLS